MVASATLSQRSQSRVSRGCRPRLGGSASLKMTTPHDSQVPSPPAAYVPTIKWGPCPSGQGGSDCGSLELPLDPTGPGKATVTSFVRRFYDKVPTESAVFMLAGGPGDTANSFEGAASYFVANDKAVTVYLVDQRGTGLSSPVNCRNPPLYNFDPTNATVRVCTCTSLPALGVHQHSSLFFSPLPPSGHRCHTYRSHHSKKNLVSEGNAHQIS
jgi:hypothetical protein